VGGGSHPWPGCGQGVVACRLEIGARGKMRPKNLSQWAVAVGFRPMRRVGGGVRSNGEKRGGWPVTTRSDEEVGPVTSRMHY
jgi:hypothetical protein